MRVKAELFKPMRHRIAIERNFGGERRQAVFALVGLVGDELFEEGPTVEHIGTGAAGSTLNTAIGTDDQPGPGRTGNFQHPFNDSVGLRVRARIVNARTVDDLKAGATSRAGPVTDNREAASGEARSVDQTKKPVDLDPGQSWRKDALGMEHVVAVNKDHDGG